jgi:hypothetical protein
VKVPGPSCSCSGSHLTASLPCATDTWIRREISTQRCYRCQLHDDTTNQISALITSIQAVTGFVMLPYVSGYLYKPWGTSLAGLQAQSGQQMQCDQPGGFQNALTAGRGRYRCKNLTSQCCDTGCSASNQMGIMRLLQSFHGRLNLRFTQLLGTSQHETFRCCVVVLSHCRQARVLRAGARNNAAVQASTVLPHHFAPQDLLPARLCFAPELNVKRRPARSRSNLSWAHISQLRCRCSSATNQIGKRAVLVPR